MSLVVHREAARGRGDHGWLQARYSFSFASWFDRARMGFGALRVLNDDRIGPGGGFPTHPHQAMEIVTVPLEGSLAHRDSTGGEGVLAPGEVQWMSAGRGIRHSEANASASEGLALLQIWIETAAPDAEPAYGQKAFDPAERQDRLQTLVSPDGADGSLAMRQRAWVSRAALQAGRALELAPRAEGNGLYLFVIDGRVELGGEMLGKRDAAAVDDGFPLELRALEDCDVLVLDVPLTGV